MRRAPQSAFCRCWASLKSAQSFEVAAAHLMAEVPEGSRLQEQRNPACRRAGAGGFAAPSKAFEDHPVEPTEANPRLARFVPDDGPQAFHSGKRNLSRAMELESRLSMGAGGYVVRRWSLR